MTNNTKKLTEILQGKKFDVAMLSDESSPCVVSEWLSSGCLVLDKILGGGFPVGRITEIYGDTSTGKSLIAAQVAALAQQDDWIVIYIDTETAVSLPIMNAVGINIDNLVYYAPDTVEEVFGMMETSVLEAGKLKPKGILIIWDSVAASSTRKEMENDYGKAQMGGGANALSQGFRKITRIVSKNNCCLLALNQVRQKIGVLFGDNETTYGGNALPFYSSVRLRLKLGQKIKEGKRIVGLSTKAQTVKNKVALPFLTCELPIYFGHGIDDGEASYLYLKGAGLVTGTQYKHLDIPGKGDVQFTLKTWQDVYDEHYDSIAELILGNDVDLENDNERKSGAGTED